MKKTAQQKRRLPQDSGRLDSGREQYALAVSIAVQHSPLNDIDAVLFEAVGRASSDSGAGFGQRDHIWFFDTRAERENALCKLQSVNDTRKLRMRFDSYTTRVV
jgi:hypothetical protein